MLTAAKEGMFSALSDPCVFFPLAASEGVPKNSRLGFARKTSAPHQGSAWSNSGKALGIEEVVWENCGRSDDSARYYDQTTGRFLTEDPMGFYEATDFYVYADNTPANFIDPFGLAPGDKYPNRRQAGVQAIRDILDKSICEHKEYAGALYKNPDGTYSYTTPRPGTLAGSSVHVEDIPAGGNMAGDYHTHGGYDPGYGNEIFGNGDKDTNDAEGTSGLPGYLGTPKGAIKIYLGNKAHPRHGKIIIVDPGIKEGNQKPCKC